MNQGNQGEGNRAADARYRRSVRDHVERGDVDQAAEKAARAREDDKVERSRMDIAEVIGREPAAALDSETTQDPAEAIEAIRELLQRFSTLMMVTQRPGGRMRSRPMAIAEREESGDLLFITRKGGRLDEDLRDSNECVVTLQDDRRYLTLTGEGRIVEDPARIEALWKPSWRIWCPDGPRDPELELVRFHPVRGEYWDYSGMSLAKVAFQAAKSLLLGDRVDFGSAIDHEEVVLDPAEPRRPGAV